MKTDFSRSPSSNGDARDEFLVHFYSFLPRLCRCLPFLLKFQPSPALFPFLYRRVAPLLPNTMLFPLATPTSKTLLRSLNHKLLIENICTANFRAHEIIAHSGYFKRIYVNALSKTQLVLFLLQLQRKPISFKTTVFLDSLVNHDPKGVCRRRN